MDFNDPRITAYVLGELDEAELAEFERYLASSSELQEQVKELRTLTSQIASEMADEANVGWGEAGVAESLSTSTGLALDDAALGTATRQTKPWVQQSWAWIATSIAIALLLCVVVQQNLPRWQTQGRLTSSATPQSRNTKGADPNTDSAPVAVSADESTKDSFVTEVNDARNNDGADFDSLVDLITETVPDARGGESSDDFASSLETRLSLHIENSQVVELPGAEQELELGEQDLARDHFQPETEPLVFVDPSLDAAVAGADSISPDQTVEGGFLGDVRVEFVEEEEVFVVRGRQRDVERVERLIEQVETQQASQGRGLMESEALGAERTPVAAIRLQSLSRDETAEVIREAIDSDRLDISETDFGIEAKSPAETDARPLRQRTELSKRRSSVRSKKRQLDVAKSSSWRRVKAIPNTSRLMVGDHEELDLDGMQVYVQVDGFRARVLVDYLYFNDHDRQLEGKFKLRLPDDASLYYFAFGQSAFDLTSRGELPLDSFVPVSDTETRLVSLRPKKIRTRRENLWQNVKEARMVPKEKAAFAYSQTVRRRVDPALVEWSGAGIFNANVFPLMPKKLHRIVVGYDVSLMRTKDGLAFELPLPEQTGKCRIDLEVANLEGMDASVSAASKVREKRSKHGVQFRVMDPEPNDTIRLTLDGDEDLVLFQHGAEEGSFFAMQTELSLPREAQVGSSRAVFLLDTSLSSRPDKFNVWLDLLNATLENNRDSIQEFAVLFFNVENRFWQSEYAPNTSENARRLMWYCQQLALEGATDLHGAVHRLATSGWVSDGETPDLFLLSDGAANWGETNLRQIQHTLSKANLGSLFAYQTGFAGTAIRNLRSLAGESGGAVFSVADEDEVERVSMAHRSRPWKLRSVSMDGGSDILTAGRVQWVYPNQPITIVGRLDEDVEPSFVQATFERGGIERVVEIELNQMLETELATRLYGQVAVEQLEGLGQATWDVATAYARQFRVTGQTCSLLMLESEADYQRFNIVPEEDLFVIKSKNAGELVSSTLASKSDELADPKSEFLAWLDRLETMPGLEFQIPTALRLVLDDIDFETPFDALDCNVTQLHDISKDYQRQLDADRLDYDAVIKEAMERGETSSADAIKVLSSLVEKNPGNWVLARDVALTAMEMNRPGQAYYLLRSIVKARPYDPSIYTAIGQCLTQWDQLDQAAIYYEIALTAKFPNRGEDFRKIAATEYAYLLRQIVSGERKSALRNYAKARLDSLASKSLVSQADLLVVMQWNTDQTDVDLHVTEPSGEECFYSHPKTRSGGSITRDIQDGFGPEMYTLQKAPGGEYDIQIKYFNTNPNRAGMRSKVYLTIYRDFGTGSESVIRRMVDVKKTGKKELVEKLIVK